MGVLVYDGEGFEFEDRVLAHIQAVITVKLRRREPFLLSWTTEHSTPAKHSVWIDNAIPLRYSFSRNSAERLNDAWLELMMEMASRSAGVIVPPEPVEVTSLSKRRQRTPSASLANASAMATPVAV